MAAIQEREKIKAEFDKRIKPVIIRTNPKPSYTSEKTVEGIVNQAVGQNHN
jgi:hypothetical protein